MQAHTARATSVTALGAPHSTTLVRTFDFLPHSLRRAEIRSRTAPIYKLHVWWNFLCTLMQETNILLNTDEVAYEAVEEINEVESDNLSLISDEDEDDYIQRKHQELMSSMPWYQRPSLQILAFGSFLYMMSTSLAEGPRQMVVFKQSCNSVADSHGICDPIATLELVSTYNFYSLLVMSIAGTTVVGRMGRLADIYGRRPVLIALTITNAVAKLIKLYFFSHHQDGLPFFGLLFGDLIDSILGGQFAQSSMSAAYVSDVLSARKRTVSLSLAQGAACMGMALGPLISDAVLRYMGKDPATMPKTPQDGFLALAITRSSKVTVSEIFPLRIEFAVLVLTFLYFLAIPESRGYKALEKSRASSFVSTADSARSAVRDVNPNLTSSIYTQIANFFRPLHLLTYPDSVVAQTHKRHAGRARACVMIMVAINTGCATWLMGVSAILVQYGVYRFNWSAGDIGHLLSFYSLARFAVLVGLSPMLNNWLLQRKFRLKTMKRQMDMVDFYVLLTGYFFEFIAFFSMAQSRSATGMLVAFVLVSLASLVTPATMSTISKFYPASRRAELFTACLMLTNVLNVAVPYVVMRLYNWSLHRAWPSMVLYIHMGIVVICFFAVVAAKHILRLNKYSTDEQLISTAAEVSLRG